MLTKRPITQNITSYWIKSIGRLLGFETNMITYSLRYFAGNSMDQNGTFAIETHQPMFPMPFPDDAPTSFSLLSIQSMSFIAWSLAIVRNNAQSLSTQSGDLYYPLPSTAGIASNIQ